MMLQHKRYDARVHRGAGYRLEIYWRSDELGEGPCMSLYVGKREHARFDLFAGSAHKHLRRQPSQPRDYYPPNLTATEYVALALADLAAIHPPAARASGWASEQLAAVCAPSAPGTPSSRPLLRSRRR